MEESILEEVVKRDFQFYKTVAIVHSFVLVIGFQLLFPNRLAIRKMFENWKINLPITGLNIVLMAMPFCR